MKYEPVPLDQVKDQLPPACCTKGSHTIMTFCGGCMVWVVVGLRGVGTVQVGPVVYSWFLELVDQWSTPDQDPSEIVWLKQGAEGGGGPLPRQMFRLGDVISLSAEHHVPPRMSRGDMDALAVHVMRLQAVALSKSLDAAKEGDEWKGEDE